MNLRGVNDTTTKSKNISAGSMTLRRSPQPNHSIFPAQVTRHLRGVIDTVGIYMPSRRFSSNFTSLYLILKEKSSKNISKVHIPMLYYYFKPNKIGGSLDLIFYLRGVIYTTEIELPIFKANISANTKLYAKRL
jgi:hypothetical protein